MKTFIEFLDEDGGVAVNNVGGGHIAAVGIGPDGEPPGRLPRRKKKGKDSAGQKNN